MKTISKKRPTAGVGSETRPRGLLIAGESEEELCNVRMFWRNELQPMTPIERELVEEVVAAHWRGYRYQKMEDALRADRDAGCGAPADNARMLAMLARYIKAARRDYDAALKRFHDVVAMGRAALEIDRESAGTRYAAIEEFYLGPTRGRVN